MTIQSIQIRNFRSIVADEFKPENLSLIVGANDVGKSNYLRALNLFFNNQTEPGVRLDWKTDYCQIVSKRKGKAEEISIQIIFQPPVTFSAQEPIVWTKTWRQGSPNHYASHKATISRREVSGRQKIDAWLERTKFKYVPAIKGPDYFRALLRDLHDTLALTIDAELRQASGSFLTSLREATEGISDEVRLAIGLDSKLQLPSSLGNFFEVLDFETKSSNTKSRSLQQRGDGVKVRHIPAILKFLADQETKVAAQGKPRVTTIWGYEEPENNLELQAQFDAARQFARYASDIQTFITTHSPAFYSLAFNAEVGTRAWRAEQDSNGSRLQRIDAGDKEPLDHSMGLMPLVRPHIEATERQMQALRDQLDSLKDRVKPVVFVGGITDKMYVAKAFEVLGFGKLLKNFDLEFIGTSTSTGDVFSGDSSLEKAIEFLRHNPNHSLRKALFLFDCDAKYGTQLEDAVAIYGIEQNLANSRVKKGIENLFPESAFLPADYTLKEKFDDYGAKKSIQEFNKMGCAERICGLSTEAETAELFANFAPMVEEIVDWLGD
jgi:hypothetical protein